MPLPTETRGEWVVGLQPDDRMPNDWLRMVARVFASYRKKPLTQAIVVYIDGLNLSLISHINAEATLNITPGQAFVDDQFLGFIDDSTFVFDSSVLIPDIRYSIVLQYHFINIFPSPEPHFLIVLEQNVNHEEMLILGTAIVDINGVLTIIDEKRPWYLEMVEAAAGNTEVDPAWMLPYVVQIKSGKSALEGGSEYPDGDPLDEEGTMDIGWSIDFHHDIGNNVNYNTRLHTDKLTDGVLFINGNKILSSIDGLNGPNDPVDPGDVYIEVGNNITVFDSFDANDPTGNLGSDSGKACYSLVTKNTDLNSVVTTSGASWCYDSVTGATSLQNRSDFTDSNSDINTLSLTNVAGNVTINGDSIWHGGNLASTGLNIMFVGHHAGEPLVRPDGSPLEDGDVFYETTIHSFYYYQANQWVEVGRSDSMKEYEFTATANQVSVALEYNPQFVLINVDGIGLVKSEYVATDGATIFFNNPLREEAVVTVMTVLSGQAFGVRVADLSDVSLVNLGHNDTLVYNQTQNQWTNSGSLPGAFPVGGIVMWSGLNGAIPAGWALCDGTNGTPDLRGRFIMGSDGSDMDNTGGSADSSLPLHTHTADHDHPTATTSSDGAHVHDISVKDDAITTLGGGNATVSNITPVTFQPDVITSEGAHTHTINIPSLNVTTSVAGVDPTGTNLPPYYTLAYIIKI